MQSWTVPTTGTYTITTFGAQSGIGGLGGRTGADFNLTAGQTIQILVGGQGGISPRGRGGGGFNGGTTSTGGTGFINSAFLANPASVNVANGVRSGNGFVQIAEITPIPFAFSPLPGLIVGGLLSRLRRRQQSRHSCAAPSKVEV